MDEAIQREAAVWAARTVARYAQSAEPELSAAEQANLHRTLAAALHVAMHNGAAPDWITALNSALDQWERDNRSSGPRVYAFDLARERVRMR
jgi:antitoxin component HigA of HigAB toxin-antitoxin module